MNLDINTRNRKDELIEYLRNKASEYLAAINQNYSASQANLKAKAINEELNKTKEELINVLLQKAEKEQWRNVDKLENILMITYCHIIVMIESRNSVRPYEYMDFSRRVGELWDPFCKLCFIYPINDLELFVPPLFADVKNELSSEISDYITNLDIEEENKTELKSYYEKVWNLVTSGEIRLDLDLHFILDDQKYVVDFKSGFCKYPIIRTSLN